MRVIVADPVCFISLDVWFGDTSLYLKHTPIPNTSIVHIEQSSAQKMYIDSLCSLDEHRGYSLVFRVDLRDI